MVDKAMPVFFAAAYAVIPRATMRNALATSSDCFAPMRCILGITLHSVKGFL